IGLTAGEEQTAGPNKADNEAIAAPEEGVSDDRTDLKPGEKSILIIEDDRKFSGILMELAREKNFKALAAGDGRHGLQLAEDYRPNAIILDIGLPLMDGWSVMERLKDNPGTRHIPVHFISGADHRMEAGRMGAIGYSIKPASMGDLGAAFDNIEYFISEEMKKLLAVTGNEARRRDIFKIVDNEKLDISVAATQEEARRHLHTIQCDCIILDIDLENGSQLLDFLCTEEALSRIPIVVYAERELTEQEEQALSKCGKKLTVKEVHSRERLLDEATLFLHQVEANLPKEQREMLEMVHNKEAILAGKKVLVADDDMRNIFAISAILEEKDMDVIVATNGELALDLLEEHPDIVLALMDIMMPKMDGYEAMRKIRAQARLRKLPIIALTAKAMKEDRAKCIEAGANDYLAKPIDADKLISLMRVWLYP
ncbi:MAG: response regulator, partial [Gammaproteobacteria bacterium]|nr:response regulator [Gammaproteobacteria bacterium]